MGSPRKDGGRPRRDEATIRAGQEMMEPVLSAIWSVQTEFEETISKQVKGVLASVD
jgi:hypothetical protein